MNTKTVKLSDISRCPIQSLAADHYRDDGTCHCPTVDDAQDQLNVALREVLADMGDDAPDEGSIVSDLLASIALDWPAPVAAEVCRMELGWVPQSLRQSRPGIAAIEDRGPGWLA